MPSSAATRPGVPRRLPYGPVASSARRAFWRIPRPTVARSSATPAAAPAATTPMAAPTQPAFVRMPVIPVVVPLSLMIVFFAPFGYALLTHVDARHPGPDPSDDLVRDGARGPRPVLGGRLPLVTRAEQYCLVPGGGGVPAQIDHELVHGDPAA